MSEYEKPCTYCKQKIVMSDVGGKWHPCNMDGSTHDCRNREKLDNGDNDNDKKKQQITLEMVQRKLESIGIIINVDRLMSQK